MCVDHFPLCLQPAADAAAGPGSAGVEGAADAAADLGGPAAPPRPPLQGSARSPRQVSATDLCPIFLSVQLRTGNPCSPGEVFV